MRRCRRRPQWVHDGHTRARRPAPEWGCPYGCHARKGFLTRGSCDPARRRSVCGDQDDGRAARQRRLRLHPRSWRPSHRLAETAFDPRRTATVDARRRRGTRRHRIRAGDDHSLWRVDSLARDRGQPHSRTFGFDRRRCARRIDNHRRRRLDHSDGRGNLRHHSSTHLATEEDPGTWRGATMRYEDFHIRNPLNSGTLCITGTSKGELSAMGKSPKG